MLKVLHDTLLSVVYPRECRVCRGHVEGHDDGVACRSCWSETRVLSSAEKLCGKCGAFTDNKAAGNTPPVCHDCKGHHYDRATALGVYEKALAAAIIELKSVPSLPAAIVRDLTTAVKIFTIETPDVIVPVPLSHERLIERGYNQADIIARAVSRIIGAPVDSLSLVRKLHTPIHRIGMDRKARELTVQNAFRVTRPKLVEGKRMLLVDDVFTSGATTSSCARTLKKNGATGVDVFTLARAVMRSL